LMHERDFVLRPLCEIVPDIKHPILKLSMHELMRQVYKK
jgi:7,8-dihydro-6-hydroxymethylpterin-pyrophosphokinase